jgi:hypothetical protein
MRRSTLLLYNVWCYIAITIVIITLTIGILNILGVIA